MSLTEQVETLIQIKSKKLEKKDEFRRLRDFYETKKRAGVAKPPEYSLPLIDTIGRLSFVKSQD